MAANRITEYNIYFNYDGTLDYTRTSESNDFGDSFLPSIKYNQFSFSFNAVQKAIPMYNSDESKELSYYEIDSNYKNTYSALYEDNGYCIVNFTRTSTTYDNHLLYLIKFIFKAKGNSRSYLETDGYEYTSDYYLRLSDCTYYEYANDSNGFTLTVEKNYSYDIRIILHLDKKTYSDGDSNNTSNNTWFNTYKYYYQFSDQSEPVEISSIATILQYYSDTYNKTLTIIKKDNNGTQQSFEVIALMDDFEYVTPIKIDNENAITKEGTSVLFNLTYNDVDGVSDENGVTLQITDSTDLTDILYVHFSRSSGTVVTPNNPDNPDSSNLASYYCIDTNEGDVVDATSLYYKGNTNNIYKTIEQKDNTLFLGNYREKFNNREFFNTLTKYKDDNIIVEENSKIVLNAFTTDSSMYLYVPNTTLSSLDKHVFKKREKYNLGLVFITNTGQKTSVYPIDEQVSPSFDAYFTEDNSMVKPVFNVTLSKDIYDIFRSRDIIGAIPVYSINFNPIVKALGIASPTLYSKRMEENANINVIYSWYQRLLEEQYDAVTIENRNPADETIVNGGGVFGNEDRDNVSIINSNYEHTDNAEILGGSENIDSETKTVKYKMFKYKYNTLTVNTPEIEILSTSSELGEDVIKVCKADIIMGLRYNTSSLIRNLTLSYDNAYTYSYFSKGDAWRGTNTLDKIPKYGVWYGLLLIRNQENNDETDDVKFALYIEDTAHYKWFYVYPWQRSKIGAEGINFKINRKDFFDMYVFNDLSGYEKMDYPLLILDGIIYNDLNDTSILRIKNTGENLLYMGNVDFIYTINQDYPIMTDDGYVPTRNTNDGYYSGYDARGWSKDPIIIRYKVAPHIVLNLESQSYMNNFTPNNQYIPIVELYDDHTIDNSINAFENYIWIKCGDLVPINDGIDTTITFEEGDFFYGRFDTLRTYPFSESEPNNITEVVSANLFSRINLDLRIDRNRGINTPTISPTNFNQFNEVYNLLNNFFTYLYIDFNKVVNARNYVNSILWTLSKVYGADIDNWCNVQAGNSIDLDGDNGLVVRIVRDNNDIIIFQETGISLLLYNENVQIQTESGLPVELANSGKVTNKRYISNNIGCQYIDAIDTALDGIYFIDGINKALYLYKKQQIVDLSGTSMKSWALNNFDKYWWLYYDCYSQEINMANADLCLSYHTLNNVFQAFLSYENIKYHIALKGRVYLFTNDADNNGNKIALTWLKNGIKETVMFNKKKELQLIVLANPNALLDKTFTNIEYRADCFNEDDEYMPWNTFDKLRAWDEYQDTGVIQLTTKGTNTRTKERGINLPSNLKKKFRIWRVLIPRVLYNKQKFININAEANTIPEKLQLTKPFNIDYPELGNKSRDRMRNPWLMIALTVNDDNDYISMIIHDIIIQYII